VDPVNYARVLGLEGILRGQNGVIRRDQALAAGLAPSRVDDLLRRRRWVRVLPRVYAVDVDPASPRVRIRSTWLWAGDSAVIAGQAAAWWWGLESTPPPVVNVIVPLPARRAPVQGVHIVRGRIDSRDIEFEDWIRVTSVQQTCLDLARSGRPDHLESALRMRKADVVSLQGGLDRMRGRRGRVLAAAAVNEVATNPWSFAERVAHHRLIQAGITGWVANPAVRLQCGIRHPDIAIEDIKLAIEINGRQHHTRDQDFERDHSRAAEFAMAGWTVLQFTWRQVSYEPEQFIGTVRATIDRLRAQP
jgi:hypothetical protein